MLLDHVVVSRRSMRSKDPYDVIRSNISVVNYLLEEGAERHELSPDALGSYDVDYYAAQVSNGGFAQLVFNSGWDPQIVESIARTLPLMGAAGHAALFARVRDAVAGLTPAQRSAVFDDGPFDSAAAEPFEAPDEEFLRLESGDDDLVSLNAAFLRSRPGLEVVSLRRLEKHLSRVIARIPDLEERKAERARWWEANKPRYLRVVEAVCQARGLDLDEVTAGDPSFEHAGEQVVAWHFLTDQGHFFVIDLGAEAVLFDDDEQEVARIDVTSVPD